MTRHALPSRFSHLTPDEHNLCLETVDKHQTHTDNAHDHSHLLRVWRHVQKLGAQTDLSVNGRLLHACALLHDLINVPKNNPRRSQASTLSADAAKPVLKRLGFTPMEQDHGHHIIRAHSFSANVKPLTTEAKILQDADRLDSLGHIGLARWIAVAGQIGQQFFHPDDPFAKNRQPDEQSYMLDHLYTKLGHLPAGFQTPLGQNMAREKLMIMIDWVDAFLREHGVEDDPKTHILQALQHHKPGTRT